MTAPALLWFRQDLRLDDHQALHAAMAGGRAVLPCYVLDDEAAGTWRPGGAARWWLHHSLASLGTSLARRGAPLVLRRGNAATEIAALATAIGAAEVHASAAIEPWARRQEQAVRKALEASGCRLVLHPGRTLIDPARLRTGQGGVYGVYTPFARAARAQLLPGDPLPPPTRIASIARPAGAQLAAWGLLPTRPDWAGGLRAAWTPGEAGAAARLADFIEACLDGYAAGRDRPDLEKTSRLSPHLAFGEISPRQVWQALHARPASPGAEKFAAELLWREFAQYQLWHHPHLPEQPLRPAFARLAWREDAAALQAWQRGRTGIPIIDAGMRQMWQTGWMHNRVRMITASFLTKHLLLPWQAGEAWFWDTLVDADLGNNAASWQWVAGSGADAAPFFRIFNPVLQGRKFDPDGSYVRHFVPELAKVPTAHLHAPWAAPGGAPPGWPAPLVDLAQGRARALAAFHAIGGAAEAA